MNDKSRDSLATLIAHVSMLRLAIKKDTTKEQIAARLDQIEADVASLAAALGQEDSGTAHVVKDAWDQPAKLTAKPAAGHGKPQ
jgi:hypothetical protein